MTFLWILLAILYIVIWVTLGMTTFRKGHFVLFWVGFFFPILWMIGALMAPTPGSRADTVFSGLAKLRSSEWVGSPPPSSSARSASRSSSPPIITRA